MCSPHGVLSPAVGVDVWSATANLRRTITARMTAKTPITRRIGLLISLPPLAGRFVLLYAPTVEVSKIKPCAVSTSDVLRKTLDRPSPCYLVARVRPAFAASNRIQRGRRSIGNWPLAAP